MINLTNQNVREIALKLLLQVGESGGFSHILINETIKKNRIDNKDKALLTEIVYGVLQRKLTLQYYLKPFIKTKKVEKWVEWLLYLSIYQFVYLNKIPDHAIINESVQIAKKRGHQGIASFVNGILRNIQRVGVPSVDKINDPIEKLSIEMSHPKWLVKRWVDQYGFEVTQKMCESNLLPKKISVRVQPLKISVEEAQQILLEEGIETVRSTLSKQGLNVVKGNILNSSLFPEQLTIQDETSMLVSEMLDVQPNMRVLDACSAPGGKTTHIAELMKNKGEIHAYDLHEKKVKLVDEKAKVLNLSIIKTGAMDSRLLVDKYEEKTFDRILLDAPCSGLGVLRSKPDIKYHKNEDDISNLSKIQLQLLNSTLQLLKDDGKIVYSTCTVEREENELQIKKLLEQHQDIEVDQTFFEQLPESCKKLIGISEYGIQIFPQDFNADGFFITRLRKVN